MRMYYVAYYLHLHNGIVCPSHLLDFLIYHTYYISVCLLKHTLYTEKKSN